MSPPFAATPTELWRQLTSPDAMRGWLGQASIEPWAGGRFAVLLPGPGGGTARGEVRVWRPPAELELSWRFDAEPETVLRFTLTEHEAQTVLVLEHARLPAGLEGDYERGWAHYLGRMRVALDARRSS